MLLQRKKDDQLIKIQVNQSMLSRDYSNQAVILPQSREKRLVRLEGNSTKNFSPSPMNFRSRPNNNRDYQAGVV